MININEATSKIKKVGVNNVRIVPMLGQHFSKGLQQIEIYESNSWSVVLSGLPEDAARAIVNSSVNRTING